MTVIHDDAVRAVARMADEMKGYDYVIHDVFTGGAEPASLFAVEFLSSLRRTMKPNGSIAIVS